jgi:hypothetical protein
MNERIGITIKTSTSIWSNGINQNAIYLANLLNKIGYSVYLIHDSEDKIEEIAGIKSIKLERSFNIPFSLIIQLGFTVTSSFIKKWKNKKSNVRLVSYNCGNNFIIDSESMLFNANQKRTKGAGADSINPKAKPDQIWSIPQMEKSNLEYYKYTANQEKATVVPFVWEPIAIEDYCQDHNFGTYEKKEIKNIAIMEPNISVMKHTLIPIAAIDTYYKKINQDIEAVYMFGADKIKDSKRFIQIVKNTEIFKAGLVSADVRVPIVDVLNKYADIVVSWQWENNLNYLWLDIAWLGWPVVHNGSLCQDIGYYYEDFNISQAAEKIKYAIENHNEDDVYLERNKKVIERYTHKNEKLKEQYKILVENVLNNKFEKYSYDWKTNSIS